MVDLLVEKKATLADDALTLAFELAVINGINSLYTYVLERELDVAEMIKDDPDFILAAAMGGSVPIVKSLVENGLGLNYTDRDGWSTLHYAVTAGQADLIRYLIESGLDINARNIRGETAYNLALAVKQHEIADYLKTAGADTSDPQFPELTGFYMGQQPPGDEPQMFLPGIVSGHDRAHSALAISPDGTEAYWTEMVRPEGRVAMMKRVDGRWTFPETAMVERDPSFSPDGQRLYYIKTRPFKPGEVPGGDPDVKEEYWYLEKTASGWSDPISTGDEINSIGVHWPCCADNDYNLYFSEFSDNMYFSEYKDGTYQTPIKLTKHFNNESLVGRSPFMSPNGDYLLFSTPEGMKISFKKDDGSWTDAVSVGDTINGSHENGSPRISPDGKYMFYVSSGQGRPWGIYWVSTDFIERMRNAISE
jgi:hypothetical protein